MNKYADYKELYKELIKEAISGQAILQATLNNVRKNKDVVPALEKLQKLYSRNIKQLPTAVKPDSVNRIDNNLFNLDDAINRLMKYAPNLIIEGRLSLILPPLFGTWVNKTFVPLYTEQAAARYRLQNYEITRYKGLGEMDADELRPVIRSPLEYIVKPPANTEEEKSIMACVTNTAVKHALCDKVDTFNFNRIIEMCQS